MIFFSSQATGSGSWKHPSSWMAYTLNRHVRDWACYEPPRISRVTVLTLVTSSHGKSGASFHKLTLTTWQIKLHIKAAPFIVTSTKRTCAIIMCFIQPVFMSHLPAEWIVLPQEKCSLTRILTCLHLQSERNKKPNYYKIFSIHFFLEKKRKVKTHVEFLFCWAWYKPQLCKKVMLIIIIFALTLAALLPNGTEYFSILVQQTTMLLNG